MPTITKADWINAALILRDGLIALAVLTFAAGLLLGTAVHAASAWLAAHWPTRPPAAPAAPVHTAPLVIAPVVASLAPMDRTVRAKRLRFHMGWSQQQIADYLGVSRTTVRRALAVA
jgi:hypothetical protein